MPSANSSFASKTFLNRNNFIFSYFPEACVIMVISQGDILLANEAEKILRWISCRHIFQKICITVYKAVKREKDVTYFFRGLVILDGEFSHSDDVPSETEMERVFIPTFVLPLPSWIKARTFRINCLCLKVIKPFRMQTNHQSFALLRCHNGLPHQWRTATIQGPETAKSARPVCPPVTHGMPFRVAMFFS